MVKSEELGSFAWILMIAFKPYIVLSRYHHRCCLIVLMVVVGAAKSESCRRWNVGDLTPITYQWVQ